MTRSIRNLVQLTPYLVLAVERHLEREGLPPKAMAGFVRDCIYQQLKDKDPIMQAHHEAKLLLEETRKAAMRRPNGESNKATK